MVGGHWGECEGEIEVAQAITEVVLFQVTYNRICLKSVALLIEIILTLSVSVKKEKKAHK